MVFLRDYQQECLDALVAYRRLSDEGHPYGGQRALVALPTGSGKTQIFAQLPQLSSKRVLVIAHREELLDQAALRIQEANPSMTVGIEQADRHAPEGCKVLVGSIQTFTMSPKRLQALRPEEFSVVVIDEAHHCHHGLAHISMMGYTKHIQDVRIGELVKCWINGQVAYRRVKRKYIHRAPALVSVLTATGKRLLATPNHRMITPNGYQTIRTALALPSVWQSDPIQGEGQARNNSPARLCRVGGGVAKGSYGKAERESRLSLVFEPAHERRSQSDEAESWSKGENDGCSGTPQRAGAVATFRGQGAREWTGANEGRGSVCTPVPPSRTGICGEGGKCSGNATSLQSRLCVPKRNGSRGDRWQFSRTNEPPPSRCKEGKVSNDARVDFLQIDESTGALRCVPVVAAEIISWRAPVYDIEVEEAHNYFVEGFLSSNSTAASYLRLLAHFGLAPDQESIFRAAEEIETADEAQTKGRALRAQYRDAFKTFKPLPGAPYLVGFTATPTRTDGTGLEWVLDDIVYSMSIREGMEKGWLCPIRGIQVQSVADISGVPLSRGDFKESALALAVDSEERNALAVQAHLDHAAGRQTLVFCVNVAHAEHMLAAFQAQGIPSAMVVGETPREERHQRIAAYRQGDIQVLVGVMVFTEGFDAPETSCILMARPTRSNLVYTQAMGRGTRIAPGKADLLVLDLVDINKKAQVQNLNTLFGLPIRLKLGAMDVVEAVEAVEALQASLPLEMLNQATSLEDIERMAREFDPLASTLVEEYIAEITTLAWVKTAFGYALGIMGKGQLGIVIDLLGGATLRLKVPQEPPRELGRYADVPSAIGAADEWVSLEVPDLRAMLDREARWRSGDATPKQIAFLKRLKDTNGKPVTYPPSITKGQASALIDRYKKERVLPEWVRRQIDGARRG